ncbi:MerR family transcriptional regulator [Streptomyces koyangensis]|uniref:MerR family transcriptional regulator n=1 Tax=Streptomyces koyangensis TaxID=188770 RepID=UPI003C2E85C2
MRTIGEAAAELGVEAHVLRHWESVGALTVRRDANGYRVYDDGALEQARAVVRAKIAALEEEIAHRRQAVTFLRHTAECRRRYLDDCPECGAFVGGG